MRRLGDRFATAMFRGLAVALFGLLLGPTAGAALRDGEPPPYIPTPQLVVDRMLALAKLGTDDYLIDLGAGDGRIVITAASRYGARALGVEIRGDLVAVARKQAAAAGVADRAQIDLQDALRTDLSRATVLTLYLGPELNEKLMPRILENMRPGTRVVSHDFPIGVWQPDAIERFDVPDKNFGRGGESTIMLWIVPANASGRWRMELAIPGAPRTEEISIGQAFQRIEGVLHGERRTIELAGASLAGPTVRFRVGNIDGNGTGYDVRATITGDTMTGTARIEGRNQSRSVPMTAKRIRARPDL